MRIFDDENQLRAEEKNKIALSNAHVMLEKRKNDSNIKRNGEDNNQIK